MSGPGTPSDSASVPGSGAAEAHRLWHAALERRAAMDGDSAAQLIRASIRAHRAFVPAHFYVLSRKVYVSPRRRREISRRLAEEVDPTHACLRTLYDAPSSYLLAALDGLLELERRHGPTGCSATFVPYLVLTGGLAPARTWLPRALERVRIATELNPELPAPWILYADVLERLDRPREAVEVLERGAVAVPGTAAAAIYARLRASLAAAGDSARARSLLVALDLAIERDGRPGLRWLRPVGEPGAPPGPTTEERKWRARLRLADDYGDVARLSGARSRLGWLLANSGRATEALGVFGELERMADSLADPRFELEALLGRGRVLSKLGRFDAAVRDLHETASLARELGDPHHLAEAYHNLAHVHEGEGRMREAVKAVDRFVEAANSLRVTQPRVMAYRDAGLLRWRLGWHAAANALFDRMATAVDEQEQNYYWAGEHYERSGRLEAALVYYRKGAAWDRYERTLNLAGLSRVYRALGRADSAEAAARRHDEARPDQLSVPLLPGIMAERGRMDEALAEAAEWVRRRESGGNLRSLALARLELAELWLRAGRPDSALTEARAAISVAGRGNLEAERAHALQLEGTALVRLGRVDEGLSRLRDAAARTAARTTASDVRRTQVALGHALARRGLLSEALAAYDSAARSVERVGAWIDDELNWTRYRGRHMDPFDAAIHLLLREHRPGDPPARLFHWSQRRKAAALRASGVNGSGGGSDPAPVALTDARARLGTAALLDYVVTDSAAVALLVTAEESVVVPLGADRDSLDGWARRIRRPFAQYGGTIDMARTQYDLAAAHSLYRAVLAPLEPWLDGLDRILVSPDGPLHRVPFSALVTHPTATGSDYVDAGYALDRYTISLLPAVRFLSGSGPAAPSPSAARPVLTVSRGAPGGEREVAAAREAWGARRTTVLTGDAATETAVRRLAGSASLLHLASHAEADDRDPLASHLRLGADSVHDGYVHLAEVAELASPARLVLLTGCETLDGPLYRGAGLMGLARAFLTGGTRAVVATHWPVPAAASPLVAGLHRRLASGVDPTSALAEAKRELRRQPETASPFLWAPFVLVQRGR